MTVSNRRDGFSLLSLFESLFCFIAAFTFTNGVLLNYLSAINRHELSAAISTYSLMVTTVFALLMVVFNKRSWLSLFLISSVFSLLYYYEKGVDAFGTVQEYSSDFIMHGLGGFIMGFAIQNFKKFVKYISFFSFVYVLILLFEPVNHSLLQLGPMQTGYLLSGLIINLIMSSFIRKKKNLVILLLAMVASAIVILFTSRGCGISVSITWITFFIWHKKRQGYHVTNTLLKLVVLLLAAYVIFDYAVLFILQSDIVLSTGSLLEKIVHGYVDSSNGRDDIWELGVAMIKDSWQTGLGFGADRTIEEGFFVHNIFLELMIDFGIPLTIVILLLYWTVVIKGIKSMLFSFSTALIMAQIFKTWVQLLFSSSYLYSMLGIMFVIGISVRATIENKRHSRFITR